MHALREPPVAMIVVAVLALGGCTGDDERSSDPSVAGDAQTTARGDDAAAGTDDRVEAAPVDTDEATAPGTALQLGEPAVVPFRSPDGTVKAMLSVKVVGIVEGEPSDLDDVEVGDSASGATPYYVTLSIGKVSGEKLAGHSLEAGFAITLLDGSKALPIVPLEPLETCEWVPAPPRIDEGKRFRTCDPYTIPENAQVGSYAFTGEIDGPYHEQPITWSSPPAQ